MYTVLGATGHSGSIVAMHLLAKGQKVRAVGRSAERLQSLAARGAEPFVSEITDSASLTRAFTGARAAYVMLPPAVASADYRAYQDTVSDAIARAVKDAHVEYVVSLSSIGADKPEKTGPVVGLRQLEEKLNGIAGLKVLHLRPGYFMENTLPQIQLIKTMGTTAGPLRPDLKLPMIATRDIGAAAAEKLLQLSFSGSSTRELQGQRDISMSEVAAILGKLVNKPGLSYIQASEEQVHAGLLASGMSEGRGRPHPGNGRGLELRLHACSRASLPAQHHTHVLRHLCQGGIRPAISKRVASGMSAGGQALRSVLLHRLAWDAPGLRRGGPIRWSASCPPWTARAATKEAGGADSAPASPRRAHIRSTGG